MDPWSAVIRETHCHSVEVEGVVAYLHQQVIEKAEETARAAKNTKKTVYVVRERNYETYNYLTHNPNDTEGGKILAAKEDQQEFQEVPAGEDNEDDTLSSILVRAMHRKQRRKEIEEIRKMKAYEEEKRKIEEEKRQCVEAKRKQSEKLREMREAHQLRVMKEDQWRAREARLARNNRMADEFRRRKLLQFFFQRFKKLIAMKRENGIKAKNHYRYKLVQRSFAKLVLNKDNEQRWRDEMATNFHKVCVLEKFFKVWKQLAEARRSKFEVARRHHTNVVLRRRLWQWKWWAVDAKLHRSTQTQQAKEHYRRHLLQKAMNHWKRYMDYKKKKRRENTIGSRLRTRVKDVLPDFSPSSTDDDDDDDDRGETKRWEAILSVMTM